ncbi:hypothetical protein Kisp01_70120 [Kineosporia sp. NBRC 101677]|uniref:ATP-dependent nuclease n=1 Tax=Kineosporia sp. NBRC 101677 TaxID=3032197 RepID=UPI0024A16E82|nr:ATP-binding protein [Kineosporia sp. NBRC 101677]GLY19998.1 hypothetical protein Kisp01_70120 [Kineosporia sp. NBRC 101677]
MRIRQLKIENFRGVRSAVWQVPAEQNLLALIGPGDSTKTTILDAVHRALHESWNVSFHDSDFHNGDVSQPIRIEVVLGDLEPDLIRMDSFGLNLCGLSPEGELSHDPGPLDEACLVVRLEVERDLEPVWTLHRPEGIGDPVTLKAGQRKKFGVFRVDDRIDTHLRWSRSSALGRLTEERHGTSQTLVDAQRAARAAVAAGLSPELLELTTEVGQGLRSTGSGEFPGLTAGLETDLSHSQGNLALFEAAVPLTRFGLGTRRLAGVAVQQLAHAARSIILVDEIEHGLEPHRLVHLLTRLQASGAQVFFTTHSPTVLTHLQAENLALVRSSAGATTVRQLRDLEKMQAILRSVPAAFLARHIIVGEGKTEFGLCMQLIDLWDTERVAARHPPSAALGVVTVEGGGAEAISRSIGLRRAGFDVTLFADSDVPTFNQKAQVLTSLGGRTLLWGDNQNVEQVVCAALDAKGLTALIEAAIDCSQLTGNVKAAFAQRLRDSGAPTESPLDVAAWSPSHFDLIRAQAVVSHAAGEGSWFKRVDRGRELARFILLQDPGPETALAQGLERLKAAVYGTAEADETDRDDRA